FAAAGVVGFIGFSPLLELPVRGTALSLLAVFPLLLAALRCGQRITVVCTLILSIFAVWGAWPDIGPFGSTPNESLLVSNLIMISASVLGLVLSADVVQRQRVKTKLRHQEGNLRAVLSHADLGIAQIDSSGQFRLVNTRYCELVHQPAAQLLRLRLQDVLQISDGSQMVDLLGGALRAGNSF